MATVVRKTDPTLLICCTAFNALKAQIGAGANFHLDASEQTVTAANATDLATSLALCNNLIGIYRFHFADTVACKAADATSLPAIGAAVDLASAQTAANSLKTAHGTHIASTSVHFNADSTNTISSANASDQGTLNTLLNELKTDFNAHMASAPAAASFRLIDA